MEQLSGLDALFLHAEMHGMPMHISSLSIYDPAASPTGKIEFRQIIDLFEDRIQNDVPLLRHKLFEVPLNMDQPYWVEDPNFDLVYHVRHIALPKPGNWQKLCSLTANLHAQPLNRGRPLWEAYIIDGLDHIEGMPKGCFAIMLKVHHALMDGRTGMAIFNSLHTLESGKHYWEENPSEAFDDGKTFSDSSEINVPKILAAVAVNNLYRSANLLRMTGKMFGLYSEISADIKSNKLKQLHKTKIRFNGSISPRRVIDRVRIPLQKIEAIRNHLPDVTVNDIALSVISGALRQYLLSKEEMPEDSLVAAVPISVRSDTDKLVVGNRLNIANISLRSDIANPLERLKRVHKEAEAGKAYARTLGNNILMEAMENIYSGLVAWGVRAAVNSGLFEKFPPANNTVITNVPGSRVPLFLCGAKLIDSFGMGPLIPNTGLFHAISSTWEFLTISFTADRQKMDDPDFYVQCLEKSFNELYQALEVDRKTHAPASKRSVRIKN